MRSVMKGRQLFTSLAVILFSSLLFAKQVSAEDNFNWKKAAQEVLNLPFSPAYIDSIRNVYNVAPPTTPLRQIGKASFTKGETLVYEVSWGVFRAGYVILTTEPDEKTNTLRIGAKALSNNFVSAFYRMRDYIISTVDLDGMYPLFFEQHLREGKKYKADGWILYDHQGGKVHVQEKKYRTVDAPAFVNDYMSVLYYVRAMKSVPGDTFTLPLFVHSKVHQMFFQSKGKQKIKVDAGTYDCIGLEPRLTGDGVAFNKKDKLEIWFTDDANKMPVMIKSKIKVGSITAKLVYHSDKIVDECKISEILHLSAK